MQAAKFQRSKVNIPNAVVDFFQAHVFAGAADADVHSFMIPADAAVGADIADLEAVGIFERRKPV